MQRRRRRRFWLALAGLAAGLLALEGLARVRWPENALGRLSAPWDMGSMGNAGVSEYFRPSGAVGWERKPEGDRFTPEGFRSGSPFRRADAFRVLVVGDSLADAITGRYFAQAESRLSAAARRPVEVWDFAVGGYNVANYLRVLQHKDPGFEPDALVMMFCLNDLSGLVPIVIRRRGDLFVVDQIWLPEGMTFCPPLFRLSHIYRTFVLWRREARAREQTARPDRTPAQRLDAALDYIDAWSRRRHAKTLFVVFPFFKPPAEYTPEENAARDAFLAAFRARGLPHLWLGEALPPRYWELYRDRQHPEDFIHPSPEGYKACEELILRFLETALAPH